MNFRAIVQRSARHYRVTSAVDDVHRERARKLYAEGDPHKYIHQVFGYRPTRDQKRITQAYLDNPFILAVGANGTGKSHWLYCLGLGWGWDALGSTLVDGRCMGGILILAAPKGDSVKEAYQKHCLTLGKRARDRNHLLPGWGNHSTRSVSWVAEEGHWYIKGWTAKADSGEDVAQSVLGAHAEGLQIIFDEIKGIANSQVEAGHARCRGALNKMMGSTNPDSATGQGHDLSQIQGVPTVYSSAVGFPGAGKGESRIEPLEPHENIQARAMVFPNAVSHQAVEVDLRNPELFEDRGLLWEGEDTPPEGHTVPQVDAGEFPYALPPKGAKDAPGPRKDKHPGHPGYPVRVFRPLTGIAYGRVVGFWPPLDPYSLFTRFMLAKGVELRSQMTDPVGPPWVVGVDAAISPKGDEAVACPWWGLPVRDLLRAAWDARSTDQHSLADGAKTLLDQYKLEGGTWNYEETKDPAFQRHVYREAPFNPGIPAWCGEPIKLPVEETGKEAAKKLVDTYGTEPLYQVDHGFGGAIGASLVSMGARVTWMNYGGAALPAIPGQSKQPANARAMWAFDLADAIRWGLVGMCRKKRAHEDLIAMGAPEPVETAAHRAGRGAKIQVMKVKEKKKIKEQLKRSPGDGDSVLQASARPQVGSRR